MSRNKSTTLLVFFTSAGAILALASGWQSSGEFPGWWPLCTFVSVAFILQSLHTDLRLSATGSTSFIMHLAGCLLFGAFWGGVIAGVATLLSQINLGNSAIKALFNVSQRVLAVVVGATIYGWLGGNFPPEYLRQGLALASPAVQKDLGLFSVLAVGYFLINSVLVSLVVSSSSERTFREVWSLNNRGVMGYDLGASLISVLVAWLYTRFDQWLGFGSLGLHRGHYTHCCCSPRVRTLPSA